MFRREAYRVMAPVLDALDPAVLERHRFALGGATRIALAHGEVRISRDLDFLGSDTAGYAALRVEVRDRGCAALFRDTTRFELPREASIDQYGIRFPARVGTTTIKIELVHEGRVHLGPSVRESFCALPCLSPVDVWTEKLLALSDRGGDPSQLDRDLVDLGVLRVDDGAMPPEALAAAGGAYGAAAMGDLVKCVQRFRADGGRRARAFAGLSVDDPARVLAGVEALASDLSLPPPSPV